MKKITLVDLHGSLVAAAHKIGWDDIEVMSWTDVKSISKKPGMAFVSPANSLGFMDGGIDYVLSRIMFPGIEAKVKAAFKARGHITNLGRPYLPIGEAMLVQTQYDDVFLVSAPTMWLPQDVRNTHNAYHAMYAILNTTEQEEKINNIILCGLCTGCGMMDPKEAIKQMYDAYTDYKNGRPAKYSPKDIVEEQPNFYMNTEFKNICPGNVIHT